MATLATIGDDVKIAVKHSGEFVHIPKQRIKVYEYRAALFINGEMVGSEKALTRAEAVQRVYFYTCFNDDLSFTTIQKVAKLCKASTYRGVN